jgi:hypothetical protein
VSILSVVETLGAVVAGVGLSEGSETWHGVGLVWAVVELAVEVFLDLVSGILKHAVGIRGAGVATVMNPSAMLRVVIGAEGDLLIMNGLEGVKSVKVALDGLGHNDLVVTLILNDDGDVGGEPVPIRFDAVF